MSGPTSADVRKYLNSHGQAFQYAVIRRPEELVDHGSQWVFEGAEFPVGDPQNIIHVDLILRARHANVYLVAECKRVDPARARWCFVKAPYTRRNPSSDELIFQGITSQQHVAGPHGPSSYATVSRALTRRTARATAHVGFELRTQAKGDGAFAHGAINDATTQVLRGMNGFVEHLSARTGNPVTT